MEKATMKEVRVAVKEVLANLNAEAETGKKVTNKDAEFAVKAVGKVLFDLLASGKNAGIHGLGTLELRHRAERQGRNPQTGEPITIEARTGVGIKPSEALKEAVRGL